MALESAIKVIYIESVYRFITNLVEYVHTWQHNGCLSEIEISITWCYWVYLI